MGLCNFFRTHIKKFAIIAAPLFKLTRKDSSYKGGPLPKEAMDAFCILKSSLTSEPVMAFPRQLKDHKKNYSLFLLEAAAALWGMDVFTKYLKGKKFIPYTDHKPLEKNGSPAH